MSISTKAAQWSLINNRMTKKWALEGAPIPFTRTPPRSFMNNRQMSKTHQNFVEEEIAKLLESGTIKKVTQEETHNTSPIGVVPKKNGKLRMIVDLRAVNKWVNTPPFSMEDIRKLKPLLKEGDWMTKIDLKDGFHHISIHPQFQRYLGMAWKGKIYQWTRLPFGLSASPYIFTKLLRETVTICRLKGVRINAYMDDLLIMGSSKEECLNSTQIVTSILESMGWNINKEKSILTPTPTLEYLGFIISTKKTPQISITPEKLRNLKKQIRYLRNQASQNSIPARKLAKLIGTLISNSHAMEPTLVMSRHLMSCLTTKGNWDSLVTLDSDALEELDWWLTNIEKWKTTTIFSSTPTLTLTTDASLTGWGASLEGMASAAGPFSPEIQKRSSNYRELTAVMLALLQFSHLITNHHILLRTDNVTTMIYLKQQGGSYKPLNKLTKLIFFHLKKIGASLTPLHLPGRLNTLADSLSRLNPNTEWQMNPSTFKEIDMKWGPHTVDRFSTFQNKLLPRFNTRFFDPRAEATDTMSTSWQKENNWVNPPFRLIPRILKKISQEQALVTLIAPLWTSAPWFPLLLEMTKELRLLNSKSVIPQLGSAEPLKNKKWRLAAWRICGSRKPLTGILKPDNS